MLTAAADKFERRLSEEISGLRVWLHDGLLSVRQELATTRVEMLKWSFLFWLGQVAAMAGCWGSCSGALSGPGSASWSFCDAFTSVPPDLF